MKKFSLLMTRPFAICSVVASCSATLVDPCDVLVDVKTQPATNAYLVSNDRPAAVGLARHQGRVQFYKCTADSSN